MSNILTKEGLEKLKTEYKEIKEIKLKEIAQRIKEAKDLGDLSENAEYHEAKNEQSFLYGKLLDLEQKIKNAQVIERGKSSDVVVAGSTVEVLNEGDKLKFDIVGSDESDPSNGKISVDSPLGTALVGHKKNDTILVQTPAGQSEYKIVNVL